MIKAVYDNHPKKLVGQRGSAHGRTISKNMTLHSQQSSINSLKFNNTEKPLSEVSFKGFSFNSAGKFFQDEVFTLTKENLHFNKDLVEKGYKYLNEAVGEGSEQYLREVIKGIKEENGYIVIPQKPFIKELGENIASPIINLPKAIGNFVVDLAETIPFSKNWAKNFRQNENSSINKYRNALKAEKTRNAVKDYLEQLDELLAKKGDNDKGIKAEIFKLSQQFINSSKGNYSTTAERVLTRMNTSFTAGLFLATDAYNLSMLSKNDPTMAKKDKKSRFRQEMGRLGISSYLTFLSYSSLKKYTNKSLGIALGVGLGSSFIAEVVGRKLAGKPILPISKAKAQRMDDNLKEVKDSKSSQQQKTDVSFNSSLNKPFDFSSANINNLQSLMHSEDKNVPSFKANDKKDKKKINPATVAGIAAGYALVTLAYFKRGNIAELKPLKAASKFFTKTRNKLVYKHNFVKMEDWNKFIDTVEKSGNKALVQKYKELKSSILPEGLKVPEGHVYIGASQRLWVKSLIDTGLVFPFKLAKNIVLLPITTAEKFGTKIYKAANSDKVLKELKAQIKEQGLTSKYNDALEKKVSYENKKRVAKELLKQDGKYTEEQLNKLEKDGLSALVNELAGAGKKDKYLEALRDKAENKRQIAQDTIDGAKKKASSEKQIKELGLTDETSDQTTLQNAFNYYHKHRNSAPEELFKKTPLMSMDKTGVQNYSNAHLGVLTKFWGTSLTASFLIADSYNLVMQRTKGDNQPLARQKARERGIQELFRNVYSSYIIKLIQDSLAKPYNASLVAAEAIVMAGYLICESFTRFSVGLPITDKTKQQILDKEAENNNKKGFIGGYHRFMSNITGKKALSARVNDQNSKQVKANA